MAEAKMIINTRIKLPKHKKNYRTCETEVFALIILAFHIQSLLSVVKIS